MHSLGPLYGHVQCNNYCYHPLTFEVLPQAHLMKAKWKHNNINVFSCMWYLLFATMKPFSYAMCQGLGDPFYILLTSEIVAV